VIVDEDLDVAELRGMLRLRRAQLAEQLAADGRRLAGVEARLHMIETEGRMTTQDVVLKEVPAVRIAALCAVAASYQEPDVSPVIQPLYPELFRRLGSAGVEPTGPGIAYYEPLPGGGGEQVLVHAGVGVDAATRAPADGDFAVLELPVLATAATIVHYGPMTRVEESMQTLARWIEENGYRADGFAREVYLDYCADDPEKGVTELQLPVVRI